MLWHSLNLIENVMADAHMTHLSFVGAPKKGL